MSEVPTQRRLADLKAALLCAGLAALTPLLARPTTNLPFNDEFSYLHMARTVAKTGTYTFDGWAAAAVGPQAYWGAAFILAFGDSAFALRCSTLVLAAITGAILYALARHAGLTRPFAVQSSAACMLSPLVLPWSASFMTDIPGFCFACLAVLAATYALIARTPFVRTLAFAALLLAGYTGGWMRQVVWLAVLLLPPLILHLRREHFPLRATLYLAFTLLTFATIRFIDGQPYNLSDSVLPTLLAPFQQPLATFRISISLLHTVIFTLWPLLIPLIFGLRRRLTPRLALLIVALAIAGHLASPPVTPSGDTRYPWFGNSFTPYGLLDFPTMPGWISPLFPLGLLKFVALLNWFLLAALLAFTLKLKFHHVAFSNLKARPTLQLLTLFSAGVLYLSLARSVATVGFDRYLIPLLPLPILALQLTRQWLTVTIPITDPIEHRRWRRRLARARREAARS